MEIIPNYHPMLVHFSIALLTVATLFYSAGLLFGSSERGQTFLTAARWNLWVGVAISFVTVLTGWMAYNSVVHDAPSHEAMTLHRNWALPTLGLWAVAATWSFLSRKTRPSLIFILFLWLSTASLSVTGYLGAENVFRHGIGVMRLPSPMGEGHGHEESANGHDHSTLNMDGNDGIKPLEREHLPANEETRHAQHDDIEGLQEEGQQQKSHSETVSPNNHEHSNGHEH